MSAGKKNMVKYIERDCGDLAVTFYKSGKWIIEIIESSEEYEFWLGYQNYCIKEMRFGVSKENTSFDEFIQLVDDNLYREKVIFAYVHEEDVFEIW